MVGITDEEQFQKMKAGNEYAFEYLFHNYYSRLCIYAYSFLRDQYQSEEIVQDILIKFWENRQVIDIRTSVKAYLYRTVHNSCQNYIVSNKIRMRYADKVQDTHKQELLREPQNIAYPEANLITQEVEKEISNAINSLPPQCKQIFEMCRFDELSYQEVAEKLDISINTVKTQMQRALTKLRESLSPYLPLLIFTAFYWFLKK